jgi:hypothetical protein
MPTRKALIQTFIIAVVWANCHVSFPIALLMLAANFAGSLLLYLRKVGDKKLPILFASMLAIFAAGTLVTPHGFGLWTFLASLHNLYSVEELQPLAWAAQPKLIAVAIFTFLSCFYLRKKVDLGDLFILVALVLIGNNCGRLIVYFCIFSCPVMGAALTQLLSAPLKQNILSRLSEALKSVALSRFYVLGIVLLSIFIVTRQPIYMRRNVPLQATTFLYEHPIAGNLFCSAHIGSYLIYKTHGAIPVFIDTRMDLYDADFVTRFTRALRDGEGWRELFAQYKIGAALVPNSFKLKEVLDKQPDWKPIYRDADFSLYTPTGQQK